jgi:hypothetical protein
MTYLKTKKLDNNVDLTKIIEVSLGVFGFLVAFITYINAYFKNKKTEKQEFIENVVRATIESSLSEYKNEFTSFKNKMEGEIHTFNTTVTDIYKEMRRS